MQFTLDMEHHLQKSLASFAFCVTDIELCHYPIRRLYDRKHRVISAFRGVVTDLEGRQHLVFVTYGAQASIQDSDFNPEFSVWCGDGYVTKVKGRLNGESESFAQLAMDGTPGVNPAVYESLLAQAGSISLKHFDPSNCHFWHNYRNSKGTELCEHAYAFLKWIQVNHPDFREQLKRHYGSTFLSGHAPTGSV